MPEIIINDQRIQAEEHKPLIETLRKQGIEVPALCYHPALSPAGECRLCAVQAVYPDKPAQIKLSCVIKPVEGMEIHTDNDQVQRARTTAFRNLAKFAPESTKIRRMAEKHGIDMGPPPDECIRCRLCIRACRELVGANALKIEKRNGTRYIVPRAGNRCIGCGTCASICPTGAIRQEDQNGLRVIYIRDEIIGQNPLIQCESCGRYFATPKFLSRIEQRTGDHPHVKEHHRYCPTCAKLLSDRIKSASRMKKI
ncbi:MAG: (2Fe-2S)-binding protein [Desulfobacteraceae bacterium]|nr:(2Fe-2S)-binding protein [Desulfobacteraceae bacterium]MCF8095301.1 (2Fe-2S)-binding protein [Desulfobacteraceae bacterium]